MTKKYTKTTKIHINSILGKLKHLTSFIVVVISVVAGFVIAAQARNNDAEDTYYTNFQSKIDASLGQDPNLTSKYATPSLSSSMFNVNGPLQISVDFSDIYGPMLHTNYANLLSDTNAIAFEGELGAKQNRINVTLGHVFSPKNRIKITAERLAQKQTFDFYSGSIDQWVSQYAGGAEIQHLIGSGFFNNISAGGYYAQSSSKDLDPIIYADESNTEWINYRHIAGANSTGGHLSLGLKPWKTGMVTVTGYYDSLKYNTKYSDVSAEDSTSMGYGVALEQYIASTLKATAEYSHRALYDTIQGGIQWFRNIRHNTAAIGASIGYTHNNYNDVNSDSNSENIYTVGLQYYFMPIQNGYTMPKFNFQSLTAWTSEPAVHMEKVMVAADQEKVSIGLQWNNPNLSHFNDGNTSQEVITWSDSASSNVPNDTIKYQLVVKETNTNNVVFNKDVTGGSSMTVPSLTPTVNYTAQMTATSIKTNQSIKSGEDTFTTDNSQQNFDYAPIISEAAKTETSVTLSWKAPNRLDNHSNLTYTLVLTNQDSTQHEAAHTYKTSPNAAGPNDAPVTLTTSDNNGDTLLPGATYTITMKVDDSNTQDQITVTNNDGTNKCSTAGVNKTIVWDDNPITITHQSAKDQQYTYSYDFSWSAVQLNPAKENGDTIAYKYTIVPFYDAGSGSIEPGNKITGTLEQSSSNSNELSVTNKNIVKTINGQYASPLKYISVTVTASDESDNTYPDQQRHQNGK